MDGWRLTFDFKECANCIELELIGNEQAIRFGLGLAALTAGERIKQRMAAGNFPAGLLKDAAKLLGIRGGAALSEYEGDFLRIESLAKVTGLTTRISVEWSD